MHKHSVLEGGKGEELKPIRNRKNKDKGHSDDEKVGCEEEEEDPLDPFCRD